MTSIVTRGLGLDGTAAANLPAAGMGALTVYLGPGQTNVTDSPVGQAVAAAVDEWDVTATTGRLEVVLASADSVTVVTAAADIVHDSTSAIVSIDTAAAQVTVIGGASSTVADAASILRSVQSDTTVTATLEDVGDAEET